MKTIKTASSITIEFDEVELKILANDLLDPLRWFEALAREKLANCKSRLIKFWLEKFQNGKSIESISTDEVVLLNLIFSQPDYENRVERENEGERAREMV